MPDKISTCDVAPREDPCGLLRELYGSKGISIAHVDVANESRTHRHERTEEVYYVTQGRGQVIIENKKITIREGDLIPIPVGAWHSLKPYLGTHLELLAITHPKFDPEDMVFKDSTSSPGT